ncbi:MAG: ATP-grasp domain-containing protein [Clostridia bacterium]|nr:ATP-grasp domain-containing protein [Clostridia bacterium]
MRKLLVIGASILQVPAIKKAKELGYYVGVIDYNPHAVGIPLADEFFEVSTIDIDGVAETAKRFAPDGIMTLATDMPMRSIAKAAQVCGLPGISMDCAIKATDKGEMIKAFEAAGVAHPWYHIAATKEQFTQALDAITYPCILKPLDNSGSRGVVLCHTREELTAQYDYTRNESRGAGVIVEEYMVGPEVSVEIIVLNGVPHILQVTDKLTTGAPHFVEMGHSQPSRLSAEDLVKIRDLAGRAALAVGIQNGPAHAEIMLTKDGPKMVEIGARMGGDCITTHLVPLSTGVDMIRATIEIACGQTPDLEPKWNKGAAIRYCNVPCGTITAIEGTEEAKAMDGVQEIQFTKTVGDTVGEIGSSTDRVGFVIAQGQTAADAVRVCETALQTVNITIA